MLPSPRRREAASAASPQRIAPSATLQHGVPVRAVRSNGSAPNPHAHTTHSDETDPVMAARALVGDKMGTSDLANASQSRVFYGMLAGLVVATIVIQTGCNSRGLALWIKTPGELFTNVLLCVLLPSVFLNAILASMHFWTLNKTKAIAYKLLGYFVASMLWAGVIGAVVAVACIPLFLDQNVLSTPTSDRGGPALVSLRCRESNGSLSLQADGSLRCVSSDQDNGTLLVLQDLGNSFLLHSTVNTLGAPSSLLDAFVQLLHQLFPFNAVQAFVRGDLVSVVVVGVALGIALIHTTTFRTRESTDQASPPLTGSGAPSSSSSPRLLFVLFMQTEVMLSTLVGWMLRHVFPFAMVVLVAGEILLSDSLRQGDASTSSPSTQDMATLLIVVVLAFGLDVLTVLAIVMVVLKSNPLTFLRQQVPAYLVAVGSSSSLMTLPVSVRTIAATQQVSMPLNHLVCSLGAALNKHGSAIYLAIASTYTLTIAGLREDAMTTDRMLLLPFVCALGACLVVSKPHGHLPLVGLILSSVFDVDTSRVPSMIAFLSMMEWLCEPVVTLINALHTSLIVLLLATQMDEGFIGHGEGEVDESDDEARDHVIALGEQFTPRALRVSSGARARQVSL
ncbi:hypothetical protein Poli38472_012999 [Pythium oligandrum]|uniref:Amino acid transporter n=1 Tax=Pythium oligandrum TaxID=41045 RepID=A0A8K1CLA2_PYTOL|nr:hypothetical protein Poli38472_012999 [Pythium oligandrum]|eukprot:TMW64377.1 hypothetical protein Poli38472_012999 [Pythium oligandrum]